MKPETAEEALAIWDGKNEGELTAGMVTSISMGGIGPSYEQCIQIGVFETIRKLKDKKPFPESKADLDKLLFDTVTEVNKEKDLGLSGAQGGAIQWLAYNTMMKGWAKVIDDHPKDRHIIVTKRFPKG